jgi:hypothetical protein
MRFSSKSGAGTIVCILALCFVLLVFLSHMVHAQQASSNLVLYDDFDERFLNPTKWNTFGACYSGNGMELECVREIRDEKLHLAHRNFGNRDTNVGFQFGQAALSFVNPSQIKSITSDLTVHGVAESNCAANQSFPPAAHIDGFFFNTGTGNSSDDIGGHIAFQPDPSGSVFVFAQISQGNNYFFFLPLGNTSMGTPLRATLTWDQPNHRFLVSWTNLLTNIKTEGVMPYSFTDLTPAVNSARVLDVVTFPANCTANPTWQYIHATFANVYIGQ